MIFLREHPEGVLLSVHAQPKASRTAVVGPHGDALKIAVQAPPVDSAANTAIQCLLAEIFSLPNSQVVLRSGATSRKKIFQILGANKAEVAKRLERELP